MTSFFESVHENYTFSQFAETPVNEIDGSFFNAERIHARSLKGVPKQERQSSGKYSVDGLTISSNSNNNITSETFKALLFVDLRRVWLGDIVQRADNVNTAVVSIPPIY